MWKGWVLIALALLLDILTDISAVGTVAIILVGIAALMYSLISGRNNS